MAETTPVTETITIPGYRIEGLLGKGGMASVYLAVQESFERQVALKVMSPLLNSDSSFAARFKRESRIVAQLNHASIVPVFDVGEYRSRHYLSMEYLPGGDLKRRILRGECDLSLALNVCTALCSALELAQRKGFVHRDIKPDNILFRADGTPVLTDFGIARALDSGRSMTVAGMLVGTPNYMSPEQVKGLELDGRSDLYSIGVVFFEILTGAVPFKADSSLTTALMHVSDPLPPLPPEYAAYQEFLDCLTAKDREERFASGAEVTRALRVIGTERTARSRVGTRGRILREASDEAGVLVPASQATVPLQSSVPQPTLARPSTVAESPILKPLAQSKVVTGSSTQSDATTGRSGRSASPQDSGVSRPSSGGAWQARAKPARTRQLLLGAAVLVAVSVIVGSLFMIVSPNKEIDSSRVKRPPLAASQAATVTESRSSPADAVSKAAPLAGNQQPIGQRGNVAAPPAAAVSEPTAAQSVAPQAIPPAPVAQLPTTSVAPAAPPVEAKASRSQASPPHNKRLTENQRRRKEADARLIAQHAAELQAAQRQAQEARIQELLASAKSEYDAGALWQPTGASAADRYREILKMQPGRAEAVAGALRVANVLGAETEHSEAAGDIYTSKLLVDQIQSLQPDYPKLGELQDRLQQLVASPSSLNSRDRGRLEKAAKFMARAEEDLGHQPLDYKAASDAVEQYDKAASTAAMAPGLPSLNERLIVACAAAVRTELSNNDPKRAMKLIAIARKHKWTSEDLDQLAASIQSGSTPTAVVKEAGPP